ncbi:TetR family transcriptional regulator C-terminal domain-containing protein [Hahella sp. SMD15-11]|uniref:TetR family transcriptional regulator C-terminal domain-containing protein n=1 Tax=Thermohahella caldifontis TaxID=3142973 RepID=A0AB39UTA7_9GAMM
MARPRKNEHIREDILDAGIELLTQQGYHGTGLKALLDALNIPKGSFYHYFESKEAFAAEAIEYYINRLLEQFDQLIARSGETQPVATIRLAYTRMIQAMAAQGCEHGCLLGNMAAEVGSAGPAFQQALQRAFANWKRRFVPLLEKGQALNQIRRDIPADELADIFWNAWEGAILRMRFEGHPQGLYRTLDTLLLHLFQP